METVALRLAYRPLRIGWCVRSGNWSDFDAVTRLACAVWGGTLGPIIAVESHLADVLVTKFAVDVLYRADLAAPELSRFVERYPFLSWPFLRQDLFQMGYSGYEPAVMDVLPAIEAIGRLPKETLAPVVFVEEPTAALFDISDGDPLQHFILANYGGYPSPDASGTNYAEAVRKHLGTETLSSRFRVPAHIESLWTPAQISRYGIAQQEVPRIAGTNGSD